MASEKIEIRLRAVEPSDTDWIYLLENEPSARAVSAELAPLSRQQIWEYASNYDANPLKDGHLRMIIDFAGEKGARAGIVDLYDIDVRNARAMVGIVISPSYRRQGIAREALRRISDYCSATLSISRIFAEVAEDNATSIALFEASGFLRVGSTAGWYRRGDRYVSRICFMMTSSC